MMDMRRCFLHALHDEAVLEALQVHIVQDLARKHLRNLRDVFIANRQKAA